MEIALKYNIPAIHPGHGHFSPPLTGTARQKGALDFERLGIPSYTVDKIKEIFDMA